MNLDNNLGLSIIQNNWKDELMIFLSGYVLEEGLFLYGDSFEYPVDRVGLDDVTEASLEHYDVENELFGNKRIFGLISVDIIMDGETYWDKEYHFVGAVETTVPVEFSFLMNNKDEFSDFKCKRG